MKMPLQEDRNVSHLNLAEELKELQQLNPNYPDRLFDLKEDQVRHHMKMEIRKEKDKMKKFILRIAVLIYLYTMFAVLVYALASAGHYFIALTIGGAGAFTAKILPADIKNNLPGKNQPAPSRSPPGE